MPTNSESIENAVLVNLIGEPMPDELALSTLVERLRSVYQVTDDERDSIIRRLHVRLPIHMDTGTRLVSTDYVPWLAARKAEIDPYFWHRFSKYLIARHWVPNVVNTLDKVSDDLLDLLGDPQLAGAWARRGLVMGDVQSGKTATYTALSCKAADAGYRLIVLLTGTLESLRRQTQERLDEGFIGLDSAPFLSRERKTKHVGVGVMDQSRTGAAFTSRVTDFNTKIMTALNFRLQSFSEPILLVVKKNKRILENLENWLKNFNAGADGRISLPLLLIDDEADNASINTSLRPADPNAINAGIRSLLSLFQRSTYVGFTATPFANIFVDPDSEHSMLGDDLFPKHFFYALEAPTNYVGAEALFLEQDSNLQICDIDDAEGFFPRRHRSNFTVAGLPPSLYEAIRCFVLSNTVRDLRGEGATHRSMLVNVSRFTDVQTQVAEAIAQFVSELQSDIRNYGALGYEEAMKCKTLQDLHDTWLMRFSCVEDTEWKEIRKALLAAAAPVVIRAVNQRTGAASLDYSAYASTGLRVIAVGGNSLSRGLTLEGLSESYFYRNSQMYDTLMQMGRWFGYRDGYQDVCRVWLTEEAQHWYAHIADATRELRSEVKRMRRLGMTPEDFGLKVRAHPDGLIVTARNKMRTANTIDRIVSVSNEYLETPRLWSQDDVISANYRTVSRFLEALGLGQRGKFLNGEGYIWNDVAKADIANLLRSFNAHPLNVTFQAEELADFLNGTDVDALTTWDVAIPYGTGKEVTISRALRLPPRIRTVRLGRRNDILVSGKSARVASRGDEAIGLSKAQIEAAESAYQTEPNAGKNIPDRAYRYVRQRPLLLLHYLQIREKTANDEFSKIEFREGCPVALGLSFPRFDDAAVRRRVRYKVNLVEWRSLFEEEEDDDGDEEEAS